MIVLSCDAPDCESEASEGAWFTSVAEAVKHAKTGGWIRVTRRGKVYDFCPWHVTVGLDGRTKRPTLDALPRRRGER